MNLKCFLSNTTFFWIERNQLTGPVSSPLTAEEALLLFSAGESHSQHCSET